MNLFTKLSRGVLVSLLLVVFYSCDDTEKKIPSKFTVTATPRAGSLVLDWEDVTTGSLETISYDVYVDGAIVKSNLNVSNYTITGLKPRVAYKVKVVAKGKYGNKREVENTFTTTADPIPSQVTITTKNITKSGFTIDWTDATIEGEKGVKYDVILDEIVKATDLVVLTYTFSGLVAASAYNVKVVAKSNEFGTSSTQTKFVTTSALPLPSQVTITSKDITNSGFIIDWTAATIEGNKGVKYDVYFNETMIITDLVMLTYTFSGLDAATTYNVKVVAKSVEFGTSSTQTKMVTMSAFPVPSQVTITERDITTSGFVINWTVATIEGSQGVKYDVKLGEIPIATDLVVLTYTFSGLFAATAYNVKVVAKSNEFGTSSTQTKIVNTRAIPVPSQVIITSKNITSTGFSIDWTVATVEGSQGVKYDILLDEIVEATDLVVLTYTFSDLVAATAYNVKVVAKSNEFKTSSTQTKMVTTTTSPVPSQFTVTSKNITGTGFSIDWTAATVEGSQGVKYDILLDEIVEATDLLVLTYTFSGLDAATTYNVKVVAKSNEFGTSSTQTKMVTTTTSPVPSQFTVTPRDIAITGFSIDWTAATIEGSQGVKYDILLDEIDEATDLEVLTYTFSNLNASTQYEVKVVAKSNEFNTTSTQTTTVLTKEGGPKPNDFTISLGEPTTGSVRVSWTSLTIDGGSGVYVNLYINNKEEILGLGASGYLFTGLKPNTDYTIRVVAKSGKYKTTLAKEISFKTKALPSTFEVTSAKIFARTTGFFASEPSAIIRFSNRTLLDRIVLNNKTYNNYFHAGDDGITFSITDEEFDALNNAVVKEGDAYYSMNGKIVSIKFTYTINY